MDGHGENGAGPWEKAARRLYRGFFGGEFRVRLHEENAAFDDPGCVWDEGGGKFGAYFLGQAFCLPMWMKRPARYQPGNGTLCKSREKAFRFICGEFFSGYICDAAGKTVPRVEFGSLGEMKLKAAALGFEV